MQFLPTQQHAYQSFSIYFLIRLRCRDMMGNMNMNYTYPTIIYESVFAQMFIFVVENIIYNICLNCVFHGR